MTQTPLDTEATKLSTQPIEVGAPVRTRSLVAPVRRAWRQLTSMRTALVLLFLLALAAVPGSLLPQRGLNPIRVKGFFINHPKLAPVLDRFSLFDVFASPWFAAIYLLLFVSLVGCLVPRLRLHARAVVAQPPRTPARLERLPQSESWVTDLPAEDAVQAARAQLRRSRWRVVVREDGRGSSVAAERGHGRETGNLVFHVSLVLLLVGIALGSVYGYQGSVLVVDGHSFANAVPSYDQFSPGRLVTPGSLTPFRFTLDHMAADYRNDGEPRSFDAHVSWAPDLDSPLRPYDIRVNHPLRIGAAKVYLISNGYAPHVVLHDRHGAVLFDDDVPCLPQDSSLVSTCVVKVPGTTPQLGFTMFFFPSAVDDGGVIASSYPGLRNPALSVVGFQGDLGLGNGRPQSVYKLDIAKMKRFGSTVLVVNDPKGHTMRNLPGGMTLSVDSVRSWATFQVKRDPAKQLVLLAAVLIVIGLVASLRIRRRRLWVRATPADGHTLVEVGGLARTDADGFATEFDEIVTTLRRTVVPQATTTQPPADERQE